MFRPATLLRAVVAAAALWVLFVSSSLNVHEMMVGAVCVVVTVVFTVFVAHTAGVPLRLRLQDLLQGWRLPWSIVSDSIVVTSVLVKDLLGIERAQNLFRVCGFETSKHDPVRIARTVLAIAYCTCSPNCIVIGIDQTQSRMLFHQLKRSGIGEMTKALGAKA